MHQLLRKTKRLRKTQVPALRRFVKNIEDHAAFIEYRRIDNMYLLSYTEVPEHLRGEGHGTQLVKEVLDNLSELNDKIIPQCSFIQKFIDENPQYHPLVGRWTV